MLSGYIMLFFTALLWGGAFIFQKNSAQFLDPFSFNFLRFGFSVPALLLLKFLPKQLFSPNSHYSKPKKITQSTWFVGSIAGLFMFLGISLQQWGLAYTTAGKSGFLTSLYIIIVPILALFIGQRCKSEVWVAAVITIIGVYLLGGGIGSEQNDGLNLGDFMTLLCTIAWAAQVLWLGIYARYNNVLNIVITQMIVVTFLSAITMLIQALLQHKLNLNLSIVWQLRYDILYTSIVSTAIAFTLQVLGQRHVPATNAALIMSSESIFALLFGIIFLYENITTTILIGCFCILCGITLAQLEGKVFTRKKN